MKLDTISFFAIEDNLLIKTLHVQFLFQCLSPNTWRRPDGITVELFPTCLRIIKLVLSFEKKNKTTKTTNRSYIFCLKLHILFCMCLLTCSLYVCFAGDGGTCGSNVESNTNLSHGDNKVYGGLSFPVISYVYDSVQHVWALFLLKLMSTDFTESQMLKTKCSAFFSTLMRDS